MPYEEFKDDFFGGQGGQSKPKKKVFLGHRSVPNIKIPLEHTVILAVAFMVCVIIAYAMGVEKGKKISVSCGRVLPAGNNVSEKDILNEYSEIDLNLEDTDHAEENTTDPAMEYPGVEVVNDRNSISVQAAEEKAVVLKTLYTVQLASFKDVSAALTEIRKLKDRGIRAEYAQKNNWYQVYATGYNTIEDAKKAQADFLPEYNDCFIRKMK